MLRPAEYLAPSELDELIFAATVPENHYLRRVRQAVNFERCRDLMASAYCTGLGRPAVEPLLLLKLEFLQYHYNLSDRQVIEQAQYNMAFRWFLDLSLHSPLPHHTLLTYFRERLGADKHQQLFDAIVGQARAQGLIKDRLRLKDATHVLANIAIPATIALVSQTRTRLLEALMPFAAERVAQEQRHAEQIRAATADLSGEERLLQRVAHLRALLLWAQEVQASVPSSEAATRAQQALATAVALTDKVLADRADPDGPDHVVSVHDPDARKGLHGTYFTGYILDVAMDADSQFVTALNVLPVQGLAAEAKDAVTLLAHEEHTHGNDVEALSMDGAGFHGPTLRALTTPGGPEVEVYVPPKQERETDVFRAEQFTLDPTGTVLTCPAGQSTTRRRPSYKNTGWQYRFARARCAACPLQALCLKGLPQTTGRVVIKNHHEAEYRAARARAETEAYRAVRREHRAIERKLGEMVRWHRARWARYRGQGRVLLQGLLTGMVVNIKRFVVLTGVCRPAGGGMVRAGLAATG
jgi:transposase